MAQSTEPTARVAALRLLGLPESATEPQIVDAYRRLVRATHPDPRPRTAVRAQPARPPIIAGPVVVHPVVDPLPEQHRPNPRRPR